MTTGELPFLLGFDLETTGTDASSDAILEWAACVLDHDLNVSRSAHGEIATRVFPHLGLCQQNFGQRKFVVSPFILEMHTKNGLWSDCERAADTVAMAEEHILSFIGDVPDRSIELFGATVHFDKAFVEKHMPSFFKKLSHRVFDVSTLKTAEKIWCGRPFLKAEAHRAMADIEESLAQAREIRSRRFA